MTIFHGCRKMTQILRNKKLWFLTIIVLLILLGPYITSRVLSSQRVLREFSEPFVESQPFKSQELTIIAFNIAHGRGMAESNWDGGSKEEREKRLDDIAELLAGYNPDIVILNEVDFHASWSFGVNQAAYLAEKLGLNHRVEQRNLDFRFLFSTWKFGNAILSRFPIDETTLIDLPGYAAWETLLAGKKRAVHARVLIRGKSLISSRCT